MSLKQSINKLSHNLFFGGSKNHNRKHIFKKFDSKYGFNYIGSVNQNSEEQVIVRGFTVSSSHSDNHFSVGRIQDRDVALVDRVDAVWSLNGDTVKHNWLVMAFYLKSRLDIPHFFIKADNSETSAYDTFFRTNNTMKQLELGILEKYDVDFTNRFAIYAQPAKSIEIQKLIPNKSARVIAAHFWPLSVECVDNVVYIYADNTTATASLLETMTKCGLWLSDHIEKQIEQI